MNTMQQLIISDLASLMTIAFMALSIVAIIRGWAIVHFFVDRVKLLQEIDQQRDKIKDRDTAISDLMAVIATARLAADEWRSEVARLNLKVDAVSKQVTVLEEHLDVAVRKYDLAIKCIIDPSVGIPEALKKDVDFARVIMGKN